MPIYEYECNCGFRFEEIVSQMGDSSEFKCRVCGGMAKRVPSVVGGFSLKGPGFYRNEYPSFDQYIGADAEKRWSVYYDRKAEREKKGQLEKTTANLVLRDYSTGEVASYPVMEKDMKAIKKELPAKILQDS